MHVEGRGVARAAGEDQVLRLVHCLLEVGGVIHRQHGGELLVRELFLLGISGLHLGDQDLGLCGNLDTGEFGNFGGGHTGDAMVQGSVLEHGLAQGLHLGALLHEIAAAASELGLDLVVDGIDNGNGLLGSANHTVVKGLGVDDGVDSELDVRGVIDDNGGVASADAQGGLAGAVGSLDHARAAGREDDIVIAHNHISKVDGGNVDPADDLLGCASLDGSIQNQLGSGDSALSSCGMRADNDRVASLQADKALENSGGGGVGGGDDRANKTDGLGYLGDAVRLVALDNSACLCVLVRVVDVLGGVVILDHLVLEDSTTGLFYGHTGQGDASLISGHRSLIEDLVDLLLSKLSKNPLGLAHACELCLKGFN